MHLLDIYYCLFCICPFSSLFEDITLSLFCICPFPNISAGITLLFLHLDICKKIIRYILIFLSFWTYTFFLSIMSSLFYNIGHMHLFSITKSKTNAPIGHLLLLILHVSIQLSFWGHYTFAFLHMSIQLAFWGHYTFAFLHMSIFLYFCGYYTSVFCIWHMQKFPDGLTLYVRSHGWYDRTDMPKTWFSSDDYDHLRYLWHWSLGDWK